MALIIGLNESIFVAFPGAGIVLGGGIAALAGPRYALGAAAAGSLAIALAMRTRLPRENAREPANGSPEGEFAGPDASFAAVSQQR
jgi:predicted MFS family arabinose efflux permease